MPTRKPPTSIRPDRAAARALAPLGLDHKLLSLEQVSHGRPDLVVGHPDDVLGQLLYDREGQLTRCRQLLPIGDGLLDLDASGPSRVQRRPPLPDRGRLDADHAGPFGRARSGDRTAGELPATTGWDDHQVERACLLEQLARGRPRTGHDPRVVVRVHRCQPFVLDKFGDDLLAVVHIAVELDHLGAVALRRGPLGRWRVLRHARSVASVPASRAAMASACAWFPDEDATTPRDRSFSESEATAL